MLLLHPGVFGELEYSVFYRVREIKPHRAAVTAVSLSVPRRRSGSRTLTFIGHWRFFAA